MRIASVWWRAAAHIIDVALLGMMQTAALLVALWPALVSLAHNLDQLAADRSQLVPFGAAVELVAGMIEQEWKTIAVTVFICWIVGGIYKVLMTKLVYGTIGKKVCGLAVVDGATLEPLSWRDCLIRWGGPAIVSGVSPVVAAAQLVTVAGYALAVFDSRRRAAHDIASGAIVIEHASLQTVSNNVDAVQHENDRPQ